MKLASFVLSELPFFVAILTLLSILFFFLWKLWRKKTALRKLRNKSLELERNLLGFEREGQLQFENGDYARAEEAFLKACRLCRKLPLLPEKRSLRNRHHMLVCSSKQGAEKLSRAEKEMPGLLREIESKLAADDALVLLARSNSAKIKHSASYQTARQTYTQAGFCYENDRLLQAEKLYFQAYDAAREARDHLLCAMILNDYSRLLAKKSDYAKAISTLEKAGKIVANKPQGAGLRQTISFNMDLFRLQKYEHELKKMLEDVRSAYRKRDFEKAAELAEEALAQALRTVKADHWLRADALNLRACVALSRGFYQEARSDLDLAAVILSEWTEQAESLSETVERNLEICKRDMGF